MDENQERAEVADRSESEPVDSYLGYLVNVVNTEAMELPITLFVKGLVVSGILTGGRPYFEALGEQYYQHFGNSTEATAEIVASLTFPKARFEPGKVAGKPPTYIHLRDARVFAGRQKPTPDSGCWWRGRLSSVDAFHFGTLSFAETES